MKIQLGFKLTAGILLLAINALSQKLPNVQTVSLRAPLNVKIDGKLTEWGDGLQAYNKACVIYYTMANDDDRLYLAVQIRDDNIAQKLVRGGITVSVSPSKRDKDIAAVTFPKYNKTDTPKILAYKDSRGPLSTVAENKFYLDSLSKARNMQLNKWLKVIGVSGLGAVNEPEVSVYNEEGISAAIRFESNLYCICELAIPLKYLGLNITDQKKFTYQIKLNGIAVNGSNIRDLREGRDYAWDGGDGKTYVEFPGKGDAAERLFPSDFWGEYALAKKL